MVRGSEGLSLNALAVCSHTRILELWQGQTSFNNEFLKGNPALAGVAQCIECRLVNQRVTSFIPSHGTCRGLQARGRARGTHTIDVALPLSPSLPLSLKLNK